MFLSLTLSPSISVSESSVPVSVCLSLSLYLCRCLCLSLYLSLSLTVSLSQAVPCVCLCPCLRVSLYLTVSPSDRVAVWVRWADAADRVLSAREQRGWPSPGASPGSPDVSVEEDDRPESEPTDAHTQLVVLADVRGPLGEQPATARARADSLRSGVTWCDIPSGLDLVPKGAVSRGVVLPRSGAG